MPNNVEQYSIVVKVPNPQETVFIARPFDQAFEGVKDAIMQAANMRNLRASGTDLNPRNASFINDVINKIREARVVVAVCSPESETHKPNSNVMYELGFAQSIGKSTVVLTTDDGSIPALLRGHNFLIYTPGEERSSPFIERMANKITEALERSGSNKLTDTYSYKDIWVAEARHRLLLEAELWDQFMTVLSFAKQVHRHFQYLSTGPLNELDGKALELLTKFESFKPHELRLQQTACQTTWGNYELAHQGMAQFWQSLEYVEPRIDQGIDILRNRASPNAKEHLNKSQSFFQQIRDLLTKYSTSHEEIKLWIASGHTDFAYLLRDGNTIQTYLGLGDKLASSAKLLMVQADSLIVNMVELLLERR